MNDALPRRRRNAHVLRIVVYRFADADVKDFASRRPIAAAEPEDDAWEQGVFPEEAVVDGPDAEVAVFPRFDADAAVADAVAAAADAVA